MEMTGTEGDDDEVSPMGREDRNNERQRLVREAVTNFVVTVLGGVAVVVLSRLFL